MTLQYTSVINYCKIENFKPDHIALMHSEEDMDLLGSSVHSVCCAATLKVGFLMAIYKPDPTAFHTWALGNPE